MSSAVRIIAHHQASGIGAVGANTPHPENAEKVRGVTRFGADLHLPGMLHGRLLGSMHAHAAITRIDTSRAKTMPGVVAVYTADDFRHLVKGAINSRAREMLADGVVRFAGQPVVMVVAETEAAATDALEAVEVDYQPLPAVLDLIEAMKVDSAPVWPHGLPGASAEAAVHGADGGGDADAEKLSQNVCSTLKLDGGDLEAGFRQADVIIEREYKTQRIHQAYMEPHASVAALDPLGNLTIYTSTQGLFFTRQETAELFGIPHSKIRVVPMAVGGGFGGKICLCEPLVASAAMLLNRPVSLVYTRTEEFVNGTPTPRGVVKLKVGATKAGKLTAIDTWIAYDSGLYPGSPIPLVANSIAAVYPAPNYRIRGYEILTHTVPTGAFRGPGATQGAFAIESMLDEIAQAIGMDPIQLRLQNVCEAGSPMPNGRKWSRIGMKECLEALYEHPLWQNRNQANGSSNGQYLEGVGVATGVWMGGLQPASAYCHIESDGFFTVVVGSVDISGSNAALHLMAAETIGVSPDRVRLVNADSISAPFSGVAGGSKIVLSVGAAVIKAAEEAKRQMLNIAADHLEASPSDLEVSGEVVRVKGVPSRNIGLDRLAGMSTAFGGRYEPIDGRGSSAITVNAPGAAAHLCKVRIDKDTGLIQVTDYVAAQDCGRAIHPPSVEGQMVGGALQGIGWALYENMVTDEHGQMLTGTFMDYTVPRSDHAPINFDTLIVEVPSESGPMGVRGVGEPAVLPGPAAVVNAIHAATGRRLTEIPVSPEQLALAGD